MKNPAEITLNRTLTLPLSTGSSPQKRNVLTDLQSLLKTQIDKRQSAQKQLLQYRERGLNIERQFRRILSKYDNNVAAINGQTYSQQTWLKLVSLIQRFNTNSQKMLQKRYNQILFMMDRRIDQILNKTDMEVQKNKKLSQEQYKLVKVEIKQALNLAKQIQFENQELKKANKELGFKFNILRQERNLLIQQLSQKKSLIIRLAKSYADSKEELSTYSPSINKIAQFSNKKTIITQHNNSITKESSSLLPSKFIEDQSTFRTINRGRITSVSKSRGESPMRNTQNHLRMCLQRQRRKNIELKSLVCNLQIKYKQMSQLLQRSTSQVKNNTKLQQRYKNLQILVQALKLKLLPFNSQEQTGLNQSELQSLSQFD